MKKFVSIYKSPKKEGMYVYLNKDEAFKKIPAALLELFGKPDLVTHMLVDENKKFAKFDAKELLNALLAKGFYLQMPDPELEYRRYMIEANDRLQ